MNRSELVEVNLAQVRTSAELHELLRESLGFPAWYGCNWDAFWDAITGLIEMPETLRLLGWSELQARLPRDASLMKSCLAEMAAKYPGDAPSVVYA